jgi:hypothetical protein
MSNRVRPTTLFLARLGGAVLALAIAAIHITDQGGFPGSKTPEYVGVGYYLLEAASVLTAAALLLPLRWKLSAAAWTMAALIAAGPLLGYVLSRGPGLPDYHEDIGNWTEPLGVASLAVESTMLALSLTVLIVTLRGDQTSRPLCREAGGLMSTLPCFEAVRVKTDGVDSVMSAKLVRPFCAIAYLFFSGAFTHVFGSSEAAGNGPLDFLFIPLALSIQLAAILLLCSPTRRPRAVELLQQNRTLVLALAVILASTIWSIDPEITSRRALALVGTTAVGLLIYIEMGRENVLRFFAINLALFAVGSVLLALAVPELGTHTYGGHVGDWRGLLSFKNQAGWAAAIFLLVWLGTRKHGWMKTWNYPLLAVETR